MVEYRIRDRGRELGSFTMEQLESMLDDHQIGMMAEVYDGRQWITVAELIENLEEEQRREREQLVLQQEAAAKRQEEARLREEEAQRRRQTELEMERTRTRQEEQRQQTELDMEAQRTRQMEVELEREAQNFTSRSAVKHHHSKQSGNFNLNTLVKPGSITTFGILHLILGGLDLICSPVVMLEDDPMSPSNIFWLLSSLFVGIWLICLGIGLLRIKRWAQSGSVYCSWYQIIYVIINVIIVPWGDISAIYVNAATEEQVGFAVVALGVTCISLIYPVLTIVFINGRNVIDYFEEKGE